MQRKYFIKEGLRTEKANDLVILHHFCPEKEQMFHKLTKFKGTHFGQQFHFFKDKIGCYCFIKSIARHPKSIEGIILKNINEEYEEDNLDHISIKYFDLIVDLDQCFLNANSVHRDCLCVWCQRVCAQCTFEKF